LPGPRGFDCIAAITFVAEIGDLSRFEHPSALMAYLGLSTGHSRHQGSVTKSRQQT
jgi:transposase